MAKKVKRQSDVAINNSNIIKYLEQILKDNHQYCDMNSVPATEYMQGVNDACDRLITHVKDINLKLK